MRLANNTKTEKSQYHSDICDECSVNRQVLHIVRKMSKEYVIAETEYGKVRGIRTVSSLNAEYISFLGIPYAAKPLGELRFKVGRINHLVVVCGLFFIISYFFDDDNIGGKSPLVIEIAKKGRSFLCIN